MIPLDAVTDIGKKAHYRGKVYKARSLNYYGSLNELEGSEIGDEVAQGSVRFKYRACSDCPVACRLALSRDDCELFEATCMELQRYNHHEMEYYKTKPIGKVTRSQALSGNDMGISLFDLGGYVSTIALMAQKGILTAENNFGLPLDKIGSEEFIEQLWKDIRQKEGIGKYITEGFSKFIKCFGKEGEKLYELIYKRKGNVVVGAGCAAKAQIILNLIDLKPDTQYWFTLGRPSKKFVFDMIGGSEEELDLMKAAGEKFFGSKLALDDASWEYKPLVARIYSYYRLIIDSLPSCTWGMPCWYNTYTEDHLGDIEIIAQAFSAVTGIETTDLDIRRIGERIHNLERAIAVREGRTREHDWPFDSVLTVTKKDRDWNWTVGEEEQLRNAMDEYYQQSGWDLKTGWPTRAKLEELDLSDVADELGKSGKLP